METSLAIIMIIVDFLLCYVTFLYPNLFNSLLPWPPLRNLKSQRASLVRLCYNSSLTVFLASHPYVKHYLLAYNVISFIAWSSVLLLTLTHILGFNPTSPQQQPSHPPKPPSSFLSSFFSPTPKPIHPTHTAPFPFHIPKPLQPYYTRTHTTYASLGLLTAFVQSAAILEVAHVLLGWVGSPLQTTAMQVASRLFLVWGITWVFENVRSLFLSSFRWFINSQSPHQTRTNPFYTLMILSWSLTESIRYAFYASSLLPSLSSPPKFLVYLRYTTFFVLYPLGAGSEAALIWASVAGRGKWGPIEWVRLGLFAMWWPGVSLSPLPAFDFSDQM
jgi:very-long-chain (3R)-3-hydroxyacyl-CoA dehydratase